MKRLSVCTDGKAHVFDLKVLDVAEIADMKCRYCNLSLDDIFDELTRREFSSGVAEQEERDCGV